MMNSTLIRISGAFVAASTLMACGGDSDESNQAMCTSQATSGANGGASANSGAGGNGGSGGNAAPVAHARLFNFVGPVTESSALDFCYRLASADPDGAWSGPVYRNTHTYPKYGNVAPYVDLPTDRLRIRVVPWGASECEATLEGATEDLELDRAMTRGGYGTIVVRGWLIAGKNGVDAMPLTATLIDDPATFPSGQLSVRVLNMDPTDGGLDVWKAPKDSDPSTWQPVMTNIPFGEAGVATKASPFGATNAQNYLVQHPTGWPDAILFNLALCPHGDKTKCWITGWQPVEGNWTVFADKTNADSWTYDFINDGKKIADPNQPHMVVSDSWW